MARVQGYWRLPQRRLRMSVCLAVYEDRRKLDADIMVVLQDWTSDEDLRRAVDSDAVTYGYTRGLHTNRNLVRLLEEHFDTALTDIYGTNLFPFIKMGHMGSSIPRRDLVRAARELALPRLRSSARSS